MLFKKSHKTTVRKTELKVLQLFTFIEMPVDQIPDDVLLWGDAAWWPESCPVQFSRTGTGEVGLGTQYSFRLKGVMAPAGVSEITQYEPRQVMERTFRRGFFTGYEVLQISERANGTRVDYEMHYRVSGVPRALLWNALYQKKYIQAVEAVLESLKQYIVKNYYQD